MKITIVLLALVLSSLAHSQTLTTNILSLRGATAFETRRIEKALALIQKVANSQEFKTQLLTMTYRIGRTTYQGYSQTGHSPEKVLSTLLRARENFSGGQDSVMDLNMEMYYEDSDTIGYTYESDPYFYMNRLFHDYYSTMETAANIFHEWLHKINYKHSVESNSERPHSVPYKLGKIMGEMSATIEAKGDPLLKELISKNFEVHCSHSSSHHE